MAISSRSAVHRAAERGITLVTDHETPGAAMDGRAHYRKAEQFAEKAAEYLGHGDGQDTASVWAAVAQVHATLAVAAGLEPEPDPELEQAGPQPLT
jgi:hypothetical protein